MWRHGDWVQWTETGGMVFFGRSDATLNAGGVRIGTAEIYRQVEQLDEIQEAIVVGQDWDNDTRVVLFVVLREGRGIDRGVGEERSGPRIRAGASPRHVPARIAAVPDIPRTKSGKIVELAVRDIVHGRPVKNREALANPEALDHFRDRPGTGGLMSERLQRRFDLLARAGRPGLVHRLRSPVIRTRQTADLVFDALRRRGGDLIEIGIPARQPDMDGPVIRRAHERARLRPAPVRWTRSPRRRGCADATPTCLWS